MGKIKYFVVSMDDDGEWSLESYDNVKDLMHMYELDEDPDDFTEPPADRFRDHIDEDTPGHVIIKGEIILPKAKEVVTRYVLDEEKGA